MRITFELEIDEILAWADPEHFALIVSAPGCCTRQTAPEQIRDDLYSVGGDARQHQCWLPRSES